jgi:murein DD-endopeptidase MepM/ murein hydrolase activator NlpD
MIPPWKWRKKGAAAFDLVVVPVGEGGKTRTFHLTRGRLALLSAGIVFVCVAATLAAITFTPLLRLVPIPASVLEARYGKQLFDTQERLKNLAEDVLVLKGYNLQLRKALGEKVGADSAGTRVVSPTAKTEGEQSARNQGSVGTGITTLDQSPVDFDLVAANPGNPAPAQQPRVMTVRDLSLPLLKPTEGFLTQAFDPARGHLGIDIAGKQGTAVHAAADGIVVFSGWTYDDGNTIIVSHGSGYITVYKHNQMLLKTVSSSVRRGDPIALLGTSGHTSLGSHLHFEVWRDGTPCDPNQFLLTPVGTQ